MAPLYFILPHVLDRLKSGQFVANRNGRQYPLKDRRDNLSLLNITRRAITYEPQVFSTRKESLIAAAEALNQPDVKTLMITGPTGRGKTSYVRGLVELMGGIYPNQTAAQLLWFDVSRHTDFDEVVRFLVGYLTDICQVQESLKTQPSTVTQGFQPLMGPSPFTSEIRTLFEKPAPLPKEIDPIKTLIELLNRMGNMPILLVIDNMEHLVTPDHGLRSPELKSALMLLLEFPNVKLVMAGQSVPFRDKDLVQYAWRYALPTLTPDQALCRLQSETGLSHGDAETLQEVIAALGPEPCRLECFVTLYKSFPVAGFWQQQFKQSPPETLLWQEVEKQLSAQQKKAFEALAMLRHGLTMAALEAVLAECNSEFAEFSLKSVPSAVLHLLLKKSYPPQMVLSKLKHRQLAEHHSDDSIRAYYHINELFVSPLNQSLSIKDAIQNHEALYAFYMQEKNKHFPDRIYPARTRHLLQEAQFHQAQAKKLKRQADQKQPLAIATEGPLTQTAPQVEDSIPLSPRRFNPTDSSSFDIPLESFPIILPIQTVMQPAEIHSPAMASQPEILATQPHPEVFQELPPPEPEKISTPAEILYEKGHDAFCHYRHNDALQLLNEALDLSGTPDLQAQIYLDLAQISAYRENWDEAHLGYQKSLALKSDDKAFQAQVLFQEALAYDESDNMNENKAIQAYEACIECCHIAKDSNLSATAVYNLATLHYEAGQFEKTLHSLHKLFQPNMASPEDQALLALLASKTLLALNRPGEAEKEARQAHLIAQHNGLTDLVIKACLVLGRLCEEKHTLQAAWNWYHEAQGLSFEGFSDISQALIKKHCGRIERKLGEYHSKQSNQSLV